MRLLTSIALASFLTISGVGHACTLAPDYLPQEFGSDGIVLGNIVERADKIMLGRYTKSKNTDGYVLNVSRSFKPTRRFSFNQTEDLSFNNVKQKYFYYGLDKNAFVSADTLLGLLEALRSNYEISAKTQYGVGGILSGISHGTDCERFVLVFDNQEYLVFLDNERSVIAQFAINSETFGNVNTLLKRVNLALTEQTP